MNERWRLLCRQRLRPRRPTLYWWETRWSSHVCWRTIWRRWSKSGAERQDAWTVCSMTKADNAALPCIVALGEMRDRHSDFRSSGTIVINDVVDGPSSPELVCPGQGTERQRRTWWYKLGGWGSCYLFICSVCGRWYLNGCWTDFSCLVVPGLRSQGLEANHYFTWGGLPLMYVDMADSNPWTIITIPPVVDSHLRR